MFEIQVLAWDRHACVAGYIDRHEYESKLSVPSLSIKDVRNFNLLWVLFYVRYDSLKV